MVFDKEIFVQRLLEGHRATLARAITFAESTKREHKQLAQEILSEILPQSGKSIRLGITGVPGVGKSTFIEKFGLLLIENGYKVAVLAIDPSSSKTQGSILGDKTRMEQLSVHPNAFVRPTAAGNTLGGLAANTQDAIILCEAAGYDFIIIETVGVGQSETEVYHLTDFFLLLMLSGAGDELQGIKRGIIEMCDGMVINKADGDNLDKAKIARSQYAKALHFFPPTESGWIPKVLTASGLNGQGLENVYEMILEFIQLQKATGQFAKKRLQQNLRTFELGSFSIFREIIFNYPTISHRIVELKKDIELHKKTPMTSLNELQAMIVKLLHPQTE